MIDTVINLAGLAFSLVSGVQRGKSADQLLGEMQRTNTNLEKLTDNIYYMSNVLAVRATTQEKQSIITDLRDVKNELEPLQKVYGGNLVSSSMIITPEKMKTALNKNPWEVLDSIRPYQYATKHSNPDMVPILFEDNGIKYLGWQMKGTLPLLFNCEYTGFDQIEPQLAPPVPLIPEEEFVPSMPLRPRPPRSANPPGRAKKKYCQVVIYRRKNFLNFKGAVLDVYLGTARIARLRPKEIVRLEIPEGENYLKLATPFNEVLMDKFTDTFGQFENKYTSFLFKKKRGKKYRFKAGSRYYFEILKDPIKGVILKPTLDADRMHWLDGII